MECVVSWAALVELITPYYPDPVEVEVVSLGWSLEFGDVPRPNLVRAGG